MYREEVGTEKELEQQRKKYASDPKVKERKKKYYDENQKKPKEMERRKRDLEEGARRAKSSVFHHADSLRNANKSFQWITDCFQHFFETFSDVENKQRSRFLIWKGTSGKNMSTMKLKLMKWKKGQMKL